VKQILKLIKQNKNFMQWKLKNLRRYSKRLWQFCVQLDQWQEECQLETMLMVESL